MTMKLYWVVLNIGWLVGFAGGETYALLNKQVTLSQFVWSLNATWPLAVVITGLVVGVLTWHFYGQVMVKTYSESIPQIVYFITAIFAGGIAASFLWTKGG